MIGYARDSRFAPPWMVQDQNDDRFAVACFYYDRRAAANLMTRAERRVGESRFANCRYLAACRQGFADRGNEDYSNRRPSRASIIRLASATISSVRLFSRLEGLSANGRVDPGAKIAALQPFPTGLTCIRYPLYSITVIACAIFNAATHQPRYYETRNGLYSSSCSPMRIITCLKLKRWLKPSWMFLAWRDR